MSWSILLKQSKASLARFPLRGPLQKTHTAGVGGACRAGIVKGAEIRFQERVSSL